MRDSIRERLSYRTFHIDSLLRDHIASNIRSALGGDTDDLAEYYGPVGDRGLFGPESIAWIVHADLASMLYGGFAALMLQTLHPRAMAGVAQHSNYRVDPTGRLRRTARFVAGTTFGPTPFVDQLFGEVLGVHERVHGRADDGALYSANDADLLTWVHVTEVSNFLLAYQRYGPESLSGEQQDQYFAETAVIAERLGATDVPRSRAEVGVYFDEMQSRLRTTSEALDAVHFLRTNVSTTDSSVAVHFGNYVAQRIVVGAAIDLLPRHAQQALGLVDDAWVKTLKRRSLARLLAGAFRWALGPSQIASIATSRIAGSRTTGE